MGRIFGYAVLFLLACCAAVYAADWAVWQARMHSSGGGMRVVTVNRVVVAPLKGGKEEYYSDGRADVSCTVSMLPQGFPQPGGQPCWWVEDHRIQYER